MKNKIIIYDIETTPIATYTWNLWPNGISHESIIQDWSIICAAWKELGSDKVYSAAVKTVGDDKELVKKLRDVLSSASIIVHHNGDKFDLKKINTRLIYHRLEPLGKVTAVDTLKEVKKVANFTSNRLDYLSKILTGQGKMHVGYELWLRVMRGEKKAIKEMLEYNKVDVIRLEEIYEILKPYMKSHPHMGPGEGNHKDHSCRACGSSNVKLNGIRYTAAGVKKQEIQCNECHAYSTIRFAEA